MGGAGAEAGVVGVVGVLVPDWHGDSEADEAAGREKMIGPVTLGTESKTEEAGAGAGVGAGPGDAVVVPFKAGEWRSTTLVMGAMVIVLVSLMI